MLTGWITGKMGDGENFVHYSLAQCLTIITCWGPCQLQSWVRRWMWVQEWPLTQSSSAGAMLYSHETSAACRIRVTLDTVYNCWCYASICWNGSEVEGLLQAVVLEILPNCICGKEYSPSSDQLHALCGNANQYPSTAFCIRLNSSKIHSSNNNIAACTVLFIPLHTLQLLVQCAYQHPQPRIQHPLSFEYFTCCLLSARAPLTVLKPSGSRIQLRDHTDLYDLPLIPLFVVFFNRILDLSKLQNSFLIIFTTISGNELKGPFTVNRITDRCKNIDLPQLRCGP